MSVYSVLKIRYWQKHGMYVLNNQEPDDLLGEEMIIRTLTRAGYAVRK